MMRYLASWVVAAGALLLPLAAFAYANPGAPTGYVNDFAQVLTAEQVKELNAQLQQFEASTSNQIAVAIIPSLGGDTVENFAVKLFEDWKIGSKQKDNGVFLLVAIEDRKLKIEVGYGLEGALPDATAFQIINNDITPAFKQGDYFGGISAGVQSIMQATQNEYVGTGDTGSSSSFSDKAWYIIVFGIFALQWLAAILGRSKSWWLGGVLGAAAGLGIFVYFALSLIAGAAAVGVLALLGLLFDFIVSSTYGKARASGAAAPWWIGGGGTGGSSFGGGFGGFGGGSSGGGGASGSW